MSNSRLFSLGAETQEYHFASGRIDAKRLAHAEPGHPHDRVAGVRHDGARIAFTVWSYEASFWSFNER